MVTVPFLVRFLPEDRCWRGERAAPLALAAAECGILLEQPCGGKAVCGKCRVQLLAGALPPAAADVRLLGQRAVTAGWRLACCATATADAVLEVPAGTRSVARKSFGDDLLFASGFDPLYPAGGWGISLDLGSTNLAAALVDLATGRVAATAAMLNPQLHVGPDVISRIAFARQHLAGAAQLHRLMVTGVEALVAECAAAVGVRPRDLVALAAAGNPTMSHTLLGLEIDGLGEAPFQGARYEAWSGSVDALGLRLSDHAAAYVLPGIRGHVGGDAVAAIMATDLDLAERPQLLIDLGTNTEVVLGSRAGIMCTSAAAGPAFEGGAMSHGMRAAPGAIESVALVEAELEIGTVGDEQAVGICGSGLIDALAVLLAAGVIEASGRLRPAAELHACPPSLRQRVLETETGRAVLLAGSRRRPVLLTAGDVRELQLVKASIAAAVELLLQRSGTDPGDVEVVLLAGAFGATIHEASARAIGLLPLPGRCQLRFVGNAAGAGARRALVDRAARGRAEHIARTTRCLELAGDPDYETAFLEALSFPSPGLAA